MKLMRISNFQGQVVPCVLDETGTARDVSSIVTDFTPETLSPKLLADLANIDLQTLPATPFEENQIAPPVSRPRNIWCIGLNYSDHAAESNLPIPVEPIVFNKASSSFCGPNEPIHHAPTMTKLDWEVELGIVIGKPTLSVTAAEALSHIAGFVVVNDVSERAWQVERGGQWVKGKSFPSFCPTGPWLVTTDEIDDVQDLVAWLEVNGERRQSGNTSNMIFSVAEIVAHLSQFILLEPGDLICTGTPAGVGAGLTPPQWLQPGDVVSLGIDRLGSQRQVVTSFNGRV
ncbi:fumarylacetoacetate hydrolase family protein [Mesorhizobium sp. CAU 1732]|uniref:fumarylacetoacetate hydrolase family protein n=1 Tax=Mesorhizobium sp. CAU 1732 TaxID=3140358 RepID=UPI00325FFE66